MGRDDKGWKVFVGNLPPDAEGRDLRDFFRDYGTINDAWVARKPPGFGFCWFNDERDARDAVRDLDGKDCLGNRVRVELSNPRRGGGGGGGGGGGFRGGGGYGGGGRSPPRRYGRSPSPRRGRSFSPRRRDSRSRSPPRRRSPIARSPAKDSGRRERSRSPVRDDEGRRERERS